VDGSLQGSSIIFFVIGMWQDTIQTVFYSWAMQLMDSDEVAEEESYYPVWRQRDMQQAGIKALI
jgi:import inner membrane translocase subunit TIM44